MPNRKKGLDLILPALGSKNYRLYFFGQAVSLIVTWIQQVAMRWLVYRLTKSTLLLGVVAFASDIPVFLLVPFAGVLADKFKRHRILAITQTLAALASIYPCDPCAHESSSCFAHHRTQRAVRYHQCV